MKNGHMARASRLFACLLIAVLPLAAACSSATATVPPPTPAAAATRTATATPAPATATATATQVATATATSTVAAATASPTTKATAAATASPTKTATRAPTASPTKPPVQPTPTRITFAAGATSIDVPGTLGAGATKSYVLHALKGQTMIVAVTSPHQDAILAISGVTGKQVLMSSGVGADHWQGTLPATQDYTIQVLTTGAATTFALQVTIPSVIAFASGATAASVQGNTANTYVVSYIAHAEKGQTMLVDIDSPNGDVFLTIYGFQDGQPLIRSVMGSPTFRGVLPATQDYIIEAVRTGAPGDFNLQLTIPHRIQFQPGATSATVNGSAISHFRSRATSCAHRPGRP